MRSVVLFLLFLFLRVSMAQADITTNLVAYWKFDDATGSSAVDSSGNSHTGTLTGTTTWVAGHTTGGLQCDGSTTKMNFTGIVSGTTFSLTAWVYPTGTADNNQTLFVSNVGAEGLYYHATKMNLYYGSNHLSTTALTLNAWNHLAVVSNAGAVTFYLNGTADGTASSWPGATFVYLCSYGSGVFFGGIVDEVRLYSRALSSGDIQEARDFTGPGLQKTRRLVISWGNSAPYRLEILASYMLLGLLRSN